MASMTSDLTSLHRSLPTNQSQAAIRQDLVTRETCDVAARGQQFFDQNATVTYKLRHIYLNYSDFRHLHFLAREVCLTGTHAPTPPASGSTFNGRGHCGPQCKVGVMTASSGPICPIFVTDSIE